MRHFHNLLYVSHGITDETEGLKQALSLARNNSAPLTILVVCPEFPKEFPQYKTKYEQSLQQQAEMSLAATKHALNLADDQLDITMEVLSDKTPAIRIIQHVLQHGHDIVIKEAEPRDGKGGFKAIDMDLLRKCPAAVWLCQPIRHSRQHIKVAVAIDPENEEKAAKTLSIRLLELARSLADTCSGELHIVSCWEYPFESYLRGNAWVKFSDSDIEDSVVAAQNEHGIALEKVIQNSEITGNNNIHHLRGEADDMIPKFVGDYNIDILVMGTVARTGIPGFMFGNTAENIVQRLSCSLMALKPHGFVSPVKAY
jgi:nucleotide-binding universal stress UspA family protein